METWDFAFIYNFRYRVVEYFVRQPDAEFEREIARYNDFARQDYDEQDQY